MVPCALKSHQGLRTGQADEFAQNVRPVSHLSISPQILLQATVVVPRRLGGIRVVAIDDATLI